MNARFTTLAAACGLLTAAAFGQGARQVAVGPWQFRDGDTTSRTMVIDTISRIAEHHGFNVIPQGRVNDTVGYPGFGHPSLGQLAAYANRLNANLLIFGKASWHTRSIWVGAGPKTISTASVDLFVYDARLKTISYEKRGVEGRSDEKENALKDVADVLITPLVTVVSGGPATPREQRAVQIALGRSLRPWIRAHDVAGRRR